MLIRYKKTSEKIAMGLLSFMPQEKDLKKLQETVHAYELNPNWHLFMWKKGEDFVGIIGVESIDNTCIIQHISVNPSHRGEGIGKEMVQNLPHYLTFTDIVGTETTKAFLNKCPQQKEGTDA